MVSSVKGKSEYIFQTVITVFLVITAALALMPFWLLIVSSMTGEEALIKDGYKFFTDKFSLYSYEYLFITNSSRILRAYGITFFITIFGTILSLLIAPMLAYPLSRVDYKRKNILTLIVFFSILFNGGLVPSYIMWTQLFHIKNTIWSLIFPNLIFNGFYIMLFKNSFRSNIHPALIEAAKIDGGSEFMIYRVIVLPLSKPILATVGLMIGLGYWNDWMNGLYYVNESELFSLQVLLNSIMNNINALATMGSAAAQGAGELPGTGIRMSMAVIGVLPIMVLYPFFQRYFIKGISMGSVKG